MKVAAFISALVALGCFALAAAFDFEWLSTDHPHVLGLTAAGLALFVLAVLLLNLWPLPRREP